MVFNVLQSLAKLEGVESNSTTGVPACHYFFRSLNLTLQFPGGENSMQLCVRLIQIPVVIWISSVVLLCGAWKPSVKQTI